MMRMDAMLSLGQLFNYDVSRQLMSDRSWGRGPQLPTTNSMSILMHLGSQTKLSVGRLGATRANSIFICVAANPKASDVLMDLPAYDCPPLHFVAYKLLKHSSCNSFWTASRSLEPPSFLQPSPVQRYRLISQLSLALQVLWTRRNNDIYEFNKQDRSYEFNDPGASLELCKIHWVRYSQNRFSIIVGTWIVCKQLVQTT